MNKKKSKIFTSKNLISVFAVLILFFIILNYIPEYSKSEVSFNFKMNQRPLVIAHGGAKLLYPENTMLAFDSAMALGVDLLEMDVRITRDSQLVCLHDETLDRTSNGKGDAVRFSLLVLKQINFGRYFQNLDGTYPYKDTIIRIPSLEQVLVRYPYTPMIIELKDKNENGRKAARFLAYLLRKYDKKNAIISSFDQATLDYFKTITNNQYECSAASDEVKKFVYFQKSFLSRLYKKQSQYLAIPIESSGIKLSNLWFIKDAHKKDYSVLYWTINDTTEMKKLIELKVDGIITDRPDLLISLLKKQEMY
jgi:glycerophosphoryl diester phosphodiesterase